MNEKYEMETMREIWKNSGDGGRIEVGLDRDGLGLVEIRQRELNGKICARMMIGAECARVLAKALLLCADENS